MVVAPTLIPSLRSSPWIRTSPVEPGAGRVRPLCGLGRGVNGDGYDDALLGAYYYDDGETDEGRAFLYLGSAAGLVADPAWTAESNQARAYFGGSVASAGDVNGDGYDDALVGAYFYENGEFREAPSARCRLQGAHLPSRPSATAAWAVPAPTGGTRRGACDGDGAR
jgi:FG-GAP repeat protein